MNAVPAWTARATHLQHAIANENEDYHENGGPSPVRKCHCRCHPMIVHGFFGGKTTKVRPMETMMKCWDRNAAQSVPKKTLFGAPNRDCRLRVRCYCGYYCVVTALEMAFVNCFVAVGVAALVRNQTTHLV